jgi:CTP synthase
MVESEELQKMSDCSLIAEADAILVPGGFGDRGIPGKIKAIKYARENNIPFLGICLGMQCAVIEYAQNVLGLTDANSSEFNAHTPHPVIDLMLDQKKVCEKGGTMRLGAYPCILKENSKSSAAYGAQGISERHRHRYEFNNAYRQQLQDNGLLISGTSPDGSLVEIIENPNLKWFVGCQFHPEFKSRPLQSHPLFRDFIKAAMTK